MRRMVDFLGQPLFRLDDAFRLEPLHRSNEVDSGLAARIHDPAWALTRQWQFGEFAGQDAGSPVVVELAGHSTLISHWRASLDASEPGRTSTHSSNTIPATGLLAGRGEGW